MIIYIIDVIDTNENLIMEGEQLLADQLYLHSDLLRGCTTNWSHMNQYYTYINSLFGKYIHFETYKYERRTSYDDYSEESLPEYMVSSIGLSAYNANREDHKSMVASMPVIDALPLERGGYYYVTSAMVDTVDTLYFTDLEFSTLFKFAMVFLELYRYLPAIYKNSDLVNLRNFIIDGIPDLVLDFYNPENAYHTDPVYLNKILVESMTFLQ